MEQVPFRRQEPEQVRGKVQVARPDHVTSDRVTRQLPESLAHRALVKQVSSHYQRGQADPALRPRLHQSTAKAISKRKYMTYMKPVSTWFFVKGLRGGFSCGRPSISYQ